MAKDWFYDLFIEEAAGSLKKPGGSSGGGSSGGGVSVQANWAQTNSKAADYIKNKPDEPNAQLQLLIDNDMLPAVYDESGKILTDESGRIILRY